MNSTKLIQVLVRFCIVVLCLLFFFLFFRITTIGKQEEKSIAILSWQQGLDKQYLDEFEKKTGVHVYITYVDSNEDIVVKLSTSSDHDYDLVMPSDYYVPLLVNKGLIKKLDKSKFLFWNDIYPVLLDHPFDPSNEYTIPFFWGVVGLGINAAYFDYVMPEASWSLLFDQEKVPGRIALLDDVYVLVSVAINYLFGPKKSLTQEEINQVRNLLIEQRAWVTAYTDLRIEYLLASKACPVVMAMSGDVAKIMRRDSNIRFVVPKEGSFISIDSFAVSASSKKDEWVYQFLNYLYNPAVLQLYVNKFEFFSPTKSVSLKNKDMNTDLAIPTEKLFKQVQFLSYELPTNVFHEIWIALKA